MHPSLCLSLTIANLDMRRLPISHKAPDWIPIWKSPLKRRFLYPAWELLIGSPEALAVSHPKGSITILWLVILTPGDLVAVERGRLNTDQSFLSLRRKKAASHKDEFQGAFGEEPCSELSGSFAEQMCSIHKHPLFSDNSSLWGSDGADILSTCQWSVDAPGALWECTYTGRSTRGAPTALLPLNAKRRAAFLFSRSISPIDRGFNSTEICLMRNK